MRAGRLNKLVTIEQVIESRDSKGGVVETWVTFAEVWASIEPLVGREYFDSKQLNAELTAKIRIRYLEGVTSKMRVLYGSRIFEIISPPIDVREGNREMVLMCREDV